MDPLSLAASVAGLVSLALQVSGTIGSYCKSVKDAPKSVEEISRELLLLVSALQQLENFLKSQPLKQSAFDQSSLFATALISCRDSIDGIASKLHGPKKDGKFPTLDRLKWPFGENEIQKRLEALRRCTSTFQFSLTIEGCELLSQTSQKAVQSLELQLNTSRKVLELTKNVRIMTASASEASRVSTQIAEILELVSTIQSTGGSIQRISDDVRTLNLRSQEAKETKILDWLSSAEYSSKHRAICDRRLPGTGQWLLDCGRFRHWLEHANPVLWCTGGPGVGKTVLTSLVIDHIIQQKLSGDQGIAYFYFDYREQETQTPPVVVANLLRQLAARKADFPQIVLDYYENYKQDQARGSTPELLHVFKQVCLTFGLCYIVIDALDECKKIWRKEVLQILKGLDLGLVHLFVTSRPHSHDIKQHFDKAEQVQVEASEADIKNYCYRMMDDNETTQELVGGDLRSHVADTVSQNAQGMFLLPVLQMQVIIEAMTKAEIRKSLQNLSTNLSQAFEDTIERISNEPRNRQQIAMQSLMWISHARNQLRVIELQHALATQVGDTSFDEDNLLRAKLIVDCCFGLIILDNESSIVRLVHHTVQDFLQARQQPHFANEETQITKICLTYLCLGRSEISSLHGQEYGFHSPQVSNPLDDFPFLGYAAAHWGHHAQNAHSDEIEDIALRFLRSTSNVSRAEQSRTQTPSSPADLLRFRDIRRNRSRANLGGLHIAAGFGLDKLIHLLLNEHPDADIRDSYGNTALHEAACNGHIEATSALIKRGARVDSRDVDGTTPMYLAVSFAHKDLIVKLLEHGADPNAECLDGWTPLHEAADKGHIDIVSLLLDNKASAHSTSAKGLNALHRAAGRGHIEIVKLLLKRDCLVDALTLDEWTPLHGASSSGNYETVKLLLEHNAAIDHQSSDGRAPLHRACRGGHFLTVSVLLQKGANILLLDLTGSNPLHRAAKGGSRKIARLLLDHDASTVVAQITTLNASGRTPLGEASYSGHWKTAALLRREEVFHHQFDPGPDHELATAVTDGNLLRVQELIRNGADINQPEDGCLTPLHLAFLTGKEAIARVLLENNATPKVKSVEGWTTLHCAAKKGVESAIRLCLDHDADIQARTRDGQTALHKVCKSGSMASTKLLIERGAKVEAVDDWGWTPLHTASAAGFKDIVELLIAEGADLKAIDKEGRTVQACAAGAGHHALVEYLRMERHRRNVERQRKNAGMVLEPISTSFSTRRWMGMSTGHK